MTPQQHVQRDRPRQSGSARASWLASASAGTGRGRRESTSIQTNGRSRSSTGCAPAPSVAMPARYSTGSSGVGAHDGPLPQAQTPRWGRERARRFARAPEWRSWSYSARMMRECCERSSRYCTLLHLRSQDPARSGQTTMPSRRAGCINTTAFCERRRADSVAPARRYRRSTATGSE